MDITINQIKKYDGVLAVIRDKKRVGRKYTDIDAVTVLVAKKGSYADGQKIPPYIDGKPTDVVEVGGFSPNIIPPCSTVPLQKLVRPLRAGLQIESGLGSGTLGAIVQDTKTKAMLGLTAAHVAYWPATTAVGEPMSQGYAEIGSVYADRPLTSGVRGQIDASVFTINSGVGVVPGVMGLTNDITPMIHPLSVPSGYKVWKVGRTTGVTPMTYIDANNNADVSSEEGSYLLKDQIFMRNYNEDELCSDAGDSGAGIYAELPDGRFGLVGILAGSTSMVDGYQYIVASRIDYISSMLSVETWDGSLICPDTANYLGATMETLYSVDGAIFSAPTVGADYVSGGELTTSFLHKVFNRLVVPTNAIKQYSRERRINREIVVQLAVGHVRSDVSIDIQLGVDAAAYGGATAAASVGLGVGLSSSPRVNQALSLQGDIDVSVILDARADVTLGSVGVASASIVLHPVLTATTAMGFGEAFSGDVYLMIDAVADAGIVTGSYAHGAASVLLDVSLDSDGSGGVASFGNPTATIPNIDQTNAPTLQYGRCA